MSFRYRWPNYSKALFFNPNWQWISCTCRTPTNTEARVCKLTPHVVRRGFCVLPCLLLRLFTNVIDFSWSFRLHHVLFWDHWGISAKLFPHQLNQLNKMPISPEERQILVPRSLSERFSDFQVWMPWNRFLSFSLMKKRGVKWVFFSFSAISWVLSVLILEQ